MHFSTLTAALVFAATALAQTAGFDVISAPTKNEKLTAGKTYTIKWDPNSVDGTVTLSLLAGETSATLQITDTIAAGIENSLGQYSWSVGSTLGQDATYGVKIALDSDSATFQYSNPFQITASTKNAVQATSATSTTAAATTSVAATTSAAAATSAAASTTSAASSQAEYTGSDIFEQSTVTASVSSASAPSSATTTSSISSVATTFSSKASFPTMVFQGGNSTSNSTKTFHAAPYSTADSFSGSGSGSGNTGTATISTSRNSTARPTTTSVSGASRGGAASSVLLLAGVAAVFFAL